MPQNKTKLSLCTVTLVSEKDYQACLGEWLKTAYAEVFQYVDPTTDDETAIRDAFRTYTPTGQQDRMVTLFLGLCAEAGLVDASKKTEVKPRVRIAAPRSPSTPARKVTKTLGPASMSMGSGLPPALGGLMNSLPQNGAGWTKADRDKFLKTFESVLDYSVPIVQKTDKPADED